MFRPFLHVVRPTDWTGKLAEATIVVMGALALFPIVLVRLPPRWLELAYGQGWAVRIAMLLAGLWILAWIRAWLLARLPLAPYLVWNTLVFPDRGQQRRVKVADIADLYVELRPTGLVQVFMVELHDGTHHELCPVGWPGAGRLFAILMRRLERRRRRADRRSA
ncbi:MAG: hypothetical protein ACE37F_15270 [Nannocystaceae bacterium]|nr:hypothetical protein [bacterium]